MDDWALSGLVAYNPAVFLPARSDRYQIVSMMRHLLDHVAPLLARAHAWLDQHPNFAHSLERTGCLRFDRRPVARGVAVGLFIALTPTVGVQTMMMIGGCLLVRGNFPVAWLISWVSNPLTMAPLYVAYHALGELVFSPFVERSLNMADYGEQAAAQVSYVALGSLLVAIPMGIAGYLGLLWGWRAWVQHRRGLGPTLRNAARLADRRHERTGEQCPVRDTDGRSDEYHR